MRWTTAALVLLLAVFAAELFLSIRQETQTFDESAHTFAGYSYWKRGDFGVNPEHPPFVKLVATIPLLPTRLPVQPAPNIWFRGAAAAGGLQFLYSHDADALLFRARAAASVFAFGMALVVFFATREMFGAGAALIALLLLVLEPVILANGALVTTDIGVSALLFAAVYLFYRYVKKPSLLRLIVCGIVTGLALAAKHSALMVLPLLVILGAVELYLTRITAQPSSEPAAAPRISALRLAGALVAITAISIFVLWSFYGFRYAARPDNGQMVPPTSAFLQQLANPAPHTMGPGEAVYHPFQARVVGFFEKHHLLPEAYLYGLTDLLILTGQGRPAFVLGKLYPAGRWFYFPVAFVIKTSLALMVLLLLLPWAKELRRVEFRRAILFLAIPPAIYFALAVHSKMQIGVRHILPIYPFLIVFAGAAAWSLARQSRRWAYVIALVLVFDAVSSLRAFPDYLPYSNELWGGSSNTYKVLSDSNVGWASGLTRVQKYLADHHITHCWFAYDGTVNPAYYHIPCTPLPTLFSSLAQRVFSPGRRGQQQAIPEEIDGPIILSSQNLVGFDFGPGAMNPYQQFVSARPDVVLAGEMLVYNGTFHVPKVAALSHLLIAQNLSRSGQADAAMAEAKAAEALNPDLRWPHEMLAGFYYRNKQTEEARAEYENAVHLYQTLEPDFQVLYGEPENPFPKEIKTAAGTGGS